MIRLSNFCLFVVLVSSVYASLSPSVNTEPTRFSQYFLDSHDAAYPLKTYPLFIGSHKEIVSLRDAIPYRKDDLQSSLVPTTQLDQHIVEDQIYSILSECTSDALIIINQPGIEAADFDEHLADVIPPSLAGAGSEQEAPHPLWSNFVRYFKRAGTFLPYLQTSSPLDLQKLSNFYVSHCDAEAIVANARNPADPIPKYIDTRKRVIQVSFDPVPPFSEQSSKDLRNKILAYNDHVLSRIIDVVPSPFVTIIYTSTSKGEIAHGPPGPYSKYPIIEEILLHSKTSTNRDSWRANENRLKNKPGTKADSFARMRLPLMQEKQEKERAQRLAKMQARKKRDVGLVQERLDALLTPEIIVSCAIVALLVFVLYKVAYLMRWIASNLLGSSTIDEPLKEVNPSEKSSAVATGANISRSNKPSKKT